MKMRLPFLLFFSFLLPATIFAQAWKELKTTNFNSYTTTTINATTRNAAGNVIYAAIGKGVFRYTGGQTWQELGSGATALNASDGPIYALTTDPAGNVYAAGWFTNALGKCYVAKWNGSEWSQLSVFNASGPIQSLASDAAGNIYAAGDFLNASGKHYVAKFNGASWSELGSLDAPGTIYALATSGNNVYAAVSWFNNSTFGFDSYVSKWNGSSWTKLEGLANNGNIYTLLTDPQGNLYAAGQIRNAQNKNFVGKWNGTSWSELGQGPSTAQPNGWIRSLTMDGNGNIYAAGYFLNSNAKQFVSKWDGTNWNELGQGANTLAANGTIFSLTTDANGKIFAAGDFTNVMGYKYVANWDPSTQAWSETGISGLGTLDANADIDVLASLNNDTLYAAGTFINPNGQRYVARWDGITWKAVGDLQSSNVIHSLAVDKQRRVYAGGRFQDATHAYVARWDGNSWQDIGNSQAFFGNANSIFRILPVADGNIYVVGDFTNASNKYFVAKWDGNSWSQLGDLVSDRRIISLAADRNGNVYVNAFHPNNEENYVAKWNGSAWSHLGAGTYTGIFSESAIASLETDPAGNVYASVDNVINSNFVVNVKKWNGTSWTFLGALNTFGGVLGLRSDTAGNMYAIGGFWDPVCLCNRNAIGYWNGTSWDQVGSWGTAPGANNYILALTSDSTGNLYASGQFTNADGKNYVARLQVNPLAAPVATNVSAKCQNASLPVKGRLTNPPAVGMIRITIDGNLVTYNAADSSFTYFTPNTTAAGNHLIHISYTRGAASTQADINFTVTAALTPAITITAPASAAAGSTVTVNATVTNAGSPYSIEWRNQGSAFATTSINSASYVKTNARDSIIALLTPQSGGCFTSTGLSNYQIVEVITAIVDPVTGASIHFAPNPVQNRLEVRGLSAGHSYTIGIHDLSGRRLRSFRINGPSATLDLSGLAAGSYLLDVVDRKQQRAVKGSIKIVKE